MAMRETHEAGIVLACGHEWLGTSGYKADVEKFAALCAATGDTALCPECKSQQAITEEVRWR